MAEIVLIKNVKIISEWYKDSPRSPNKARFVDLNNDMEGKLVYWGKTLKEVFVGQYYEVEIDKVTENDFGLEYRVKKSMEKGIGPKLMNLITTTVGEKIRSDAVPDMKSTEIMEAEIMILEETWHQNKNKPQLWRIEARNLTPEIPEDGYLIFNGGSPPTVELSSSFKFWVIITRSDKYITFTIQPAGYQPEKDSEGQLDSGEKSSDDPIFVKFFLDVLSKKDSMNYVPAYKEYRASSINNCVRQTLISKWSRDMTSEELEKVERLRKQGDYDRCRIGAADVGTGIHDYIEKVNKEYPDIYVSSEELISINVEGIRIVGHYDLLVEIEGQRYVVDIKTTNPKWSNTKYEFKVNDHFKQLIVYQHALGGIPGLILYVERNSGKLTVFKQEYTENKFRKTLNLFKAAAQFEAVHALPMIPDDYRSDDKWPCKKGEWQCYYWHICWEGSNSFKTGVRE